jgi:inosine/xanthosine triphosphate pyrophosphatase family protein
VIAATRNREKLRLMGSLLPPGYVLESLPAGIDVDEPYPVQGADGEALTRIAVAKAVAASRLAGGEMSIATDGGLLFPGLAGWEPALTRRFAGADASNTDRAVALLERASGLEGNERRVAWREAVAVAERGRVVLSVTAESEPGWLATTLPGEDIAGDGFWVPCLWLDAPGGLIHPGGGQGHWARLAAIVQPFVHGLLCGEGRDARGA